MLLFSRYAYDAFAAYFFFFFYAAALDDTLPHTRRYYAFAPHVSLRQRLA